MDDLEKDFGDIHFCVRELIMLSRFWATTMKKGKRAKGEFMNHQRAPAAEPWFLGQVEQTI